MSAWACIAARNEAETIGVLVERLGRRGLPVVVVDDGSSDGTDLMAAAAGASVIRHEYGQGIGPSCMSAWRHALRNGARAIVQLDAGGSHSPDSAEGLLNMLGNDPRTMVIGSRFLHGSRYTGRPWRRTMSRLASAMCNARTGLRLSDWTSGYRAFSAHAAAGLLRPYPARMHGWQIDVLGQAIKMGYTVLEVPVSYRAGRSSFRLSTALEAVGAWRRL